MYNFESKRRGRRGISVRIPVFSQSIGVHGAPKASGVRRCGRRGCGAVAARPPCN